MKCPEGIGFKQGPKHPKWSVRAQPRIQPYSTKRAHQPPVCLYSRLYTLYHHKCTPFHLLFTRIAGVCATTVGVMQLSGVAVMTWAGLHRFLIGKFTMVVVWSGA